MCAERLSRRRLLLSLGLTSALAGCTGTSDRNPGNETSTEGQPDESETDRQPNENNPETQADDTDRQFESFVTADDTQLTLDDQPVYLFGTRPHFVMNFNEPAEWIEEMFELMARNGYTLARVHAFQPSWGDESQQPQPGAVSEPVMQRLDRVIDTARTYGIRLSLMLINAKPALHIADGLDDKYGVNAHTYANYADTAEEYDDFYTTRECIELYKQRVETVLTRTNTITGVEYRNDPTILLWELGNEIEYEEPWKHEDPSLRPWIEEVSAHIKSLDENHLVTTGEFGWAGRNNYVADHQPDTVDLCSIHYYPGPRSYDLPNDPGRDHPGLLKDLIESGHRELNKPVYVGEYNWGVETGAEPPLQERNEQLRRMHEVFDETDVAAAAYHMLSLDTYHDWPRGNPTTFGDTDDGSMEEFRRVSEIQSDKSADGTLPERTLSQ